MKKISVIALLLVSLLGLSGCGNQQTNKQPQKDSSTVAGKSKESTVKSDTATSKNDASVEQSKSEKTKNQQVRIIPVQRLLKCLQIPKLQKQTIR